jgi:N-acetylglutamate synthase-like GNAT family acetyltransferase
VLDKSGEVAACGSLWHGEHFGKQLWRIHWIATKSNYQGKGLIKALLTKLLDIYDELGFDGFVYLTSQTWSYKAINLYSKFGFMPYKGEKPQNWITENYDSENNKAWQIIDCKIAEYKIKQISDSIAPCGLVCKLCHFADSCGSCKSETNCCGSRKSDEGCYQYNCCEEKGFDGCWQCEIAPCDKGMFSDMKDIRLRAFIIYIKQHGKDKLADRLYHNALKGIHYGHGKDYDNLGSIKAVIERIEGKMIKQLGLKDLPIYADVIRDSFATVAKDFGLTKDNCPGHTSFISNERLQSKIGDGYYPFGYFKDEKLVVLYL